MKAVWIRTIILIFALVNNALTLAGHSPLPFSNEDIEIFVSGAFTAVAAIATWWKNNSFTKSAKQADEYLKEIKKQ